MFLESYAGFHCNRKLYIQTILAEEEPLDEDGNLKPFPNPFLILASTTDLQPEKVTFALAVLLIIMGGTFVRARMGSYINGLRFVKAAGLLNYEDMKKPERLEEIKTALLCSGYQKTKIDAKAQELQEFAGVISKANGWLPSDQKTLSKLPGLNRKTADVLRQDCFGLTSSMNLNQFNVKLLIAAGFFDFEDSFFPNGKGDDLLDVDYDLVYRSGAQGSLKLWVPLHMYGLFDKLTALGYLLDQPLCTVYDQKRLKARQSILGFVTKLFTPDNGGKLMVVLSHAMDYFDKCRNADWRVTEVKKAYSRKMTEKSKVSIATKRHLQPLPSTKTLQTFEMNMMSIWESENEEELESELPAFRKLITSQTCNFQTNGKLWSPLMILAGLDDATGIRHAFDVGADPLLRDSGGWTALHWAACNGQIEAAKALLERNDQTALNTRDNSGRTPLKLAVEEEQTEMVEYLKYQMHGPVFEIVIDWKDGPAPYDKPIPIDGSTCVTPIGAIIEMFEKDVDTMIGEGHKFRYTFAGDEIKDRSATVGLLGINEDSDSIIAALVPPA
jgi:Ankyrin repeats (3 copies)